jgi:hypothetical protein
MPEENPVRRALEAWRSGQIGEPALMRRLVSFGAWMVPVPEEGVGALLAGGAPRFALSDEDDGRAHLHLFSAGEVYDAWRALPGSAAPAQQHFLTVSGAWLFGLAFEGVDMLDVDPGAAWHVVYRRKVQFARLRALAGAVEVEGALLAARTGTTKPGQMALVRNYQHYLVASREGADGRSGWLLAPDGRGRKLAAVFTHADALETFLAEQGLPPPTLEEGGTLDIECEGPRLFELLAQRTTLDGFVFNPTGPGRPVAFAQAAAGVFLSVT